MKSETKVCQNCKIEFEITDEDLNFYTKISVPPPTFCPECRMIRRLCWRNEISLFRRKCNVLSHDENMISIYHPDEKLNVYDYKYWWSDNWDALDYGKDYDFKKPFFVQWIELYRNFPLQTLSNSKATNSEYCNVAEESRDCYMASASWNIETTFYSNRVVETKDSSDLYIADKVELCYDDVNSSNCYHLLYSNNCVNCVDSYFLYDCHGCTNCFGCTNLRNKSFCMWNQQMTQEEYNINLLKINLKNFKEIKILKDKFKFLCLKSLHRFATQIKVVNSVGDNLDEVKNCQNCFDAKEKIENSKNIHWARKMIKDVYDSGPGIGALELGYEVFDTGAGGGNILFSSVVYYGENVEYSFNCYGSTNLFGCIGLRNKNYCILNKQYSKDEYKKLVSKIKQQMMEIPYIDKKGRVYKYGEFFPAELSPFCYNETQAQDYFPIDEEKAKEIGFRWRKRNINDYKITIKAEDIPYNLDEVKDSIIKEIIECENKENSNSRCAKAFKITQEELNLYRRIGVPIPHLCFFCRHEERLKMRNPMKLWHRKCMKENCTNEFETSYSPDRPEIIYCEECYKREIY